MAFVGTRDDLKKIHFKVFPTLGYAPRMLLAAASAAIGLIIQFQHATVALVVGAAVVFFAILLTLVDSKTNKPKRLRGKRVWERVTPEEYARITGLVERGKRWARRDALGANNALGCGVGLLIALVLLVGFAYLIIEVDRYLATVWAVDGAILLVLTFGFGTRQAWKPGDLLLRIDVLQDIMASQAACPMGRLTLQPMLEVQRGSHGRQLPRDARLLITVDRGPEDLIGVQVQCSINRVGSNAYPYVYAVIIARKAFDLGRRLGKATPGPKDVLTLESADEEVDVAVLRQRTTKTSGYHTKRSDQDRIFRHAATLALWLANLP